MLVIEPYICTFLLLLISFRTKVTQWPAPKTFRSRCWPTK